MVTRKNYLLAFLQYALLIFMSILVLLPIVVVFSASFKTSAEFNSTTAFTLPTFEAGFSAYFTAFTKGKMLKAFLNTAILIVFTCVGSVLTGSMTAYVLNRFRFRARKLVYNLFMWIALIPAITAQVATFQIIQFLGLYNKMAGYIVLSMGTDILSIMIYLQFLRNISSSLDESAIIDGANYLEVFAKIIFPLLQPATVTIIILKCVNVYNDFYNPLLYMPKSSLLVISTSLYKFKGPFGTAWNMISAGVIITVIPTFILFMLLQKYIYSGMATGSVKE